MLQRVACNNLSPVPGSRKSKRPRGKRHGRGNKGAKSKSGNSVPRGFEGGQSPLQITSPKWITDKMVKERGKCKELALGHLQYLINNGRLDPFNKIDLRVLRRAGVTNASSTKKLLVTGRDGSFLQTPLTIEAHEFEEDAIKRIEELGGSVTAVHLPPPSARALLFPDKYDKNTLFAAPVSNKERITYFSWKKRGYLSPPKLYENITNLEFLKRYVIIRPTKNYVLVYPSLAQEYDDLGIDLDSLPFADQFYDDQKIIIERVENMNKTGTFDEKILNYLPKMKNPPLDKMKNLHPELLNWLLEYKNKYLAEIQEKNEEIRKRQESENEELGEGFKYFVKSESTK